MPYMTLACVVRHGSKRDCWKTVALSRPGPSIGLPAISMRPESGERRPVTMLRNVVLPQPDGPTMHTNSPSATDRLTLESAGIGSGSSFIQKYLETPVATSFWVGPLIALPCVFECLAERLRAPGRNLVPDTRAEHLLEEALIGEPIDHGLVDGAAEVKRRHLRRFGLATLDDALQGRRHDIGDALEYLRLHRFRVEPLERLVVRLQILLEHGQHERLVVVEPLHRLDVRLEQRFDELRRLRQHAAAEHVARRDGDLAEVL